jgi:NADH-quinone oxidoreductase subunit K
MSTLILQRYLAVGAILFVIGLLGFMTRRNLIVLFLSTELMFQGIALNFIAFGRYHMGQAFFHGQAFVIFILVIAAAEASLALGLVVLLYRRKSTLDAEAWRELKG